MGDAETAYHVVCRECRTEELARSEQDARRVADDHVSTADHRVAVARVEGRIEE